MDDIEKRLQDHIDKLDRQLQSRRDVSDVTITKTLHAFSIRPSGDRDGCTPIRITAPATRYARTSSNDVSVVAFVRYADLPICDAYADPTRHIAMFYTCDVCSASPRGCAIVKGCDTSANVVTILCIPCLRFMWGKGQGDRYSIDWAQKCWLCSREEFREHAEIKYMNDSVPMTESVQTYFAKHPEEMPIKLVEASKGVARAAKVRDVEATENHIMRKKLQDRKKRHELERKLRGQIRLMSSAR